LCDFLVAEEDIEDAVYGGGAKSHGLPVEGVADFEWTALEPDFSAELDLSDEVAGLVEERREDVGEASGRGLVARGWDGQLESVVGSLEVIDVAPVVEGPLSVGEIREAVACEQFFIQGSMESFVFALGLWMVGAGVRDADIEPDEPRGQRSEAMVAVAAPG
jgi:hypothetical protein